MKHTAIKVIRGLAIVLVGASTVAQASPSCKKSNLVNNQVHPDLGVISSDQYELLREALLADAGKVSQKWGEFNFINDTRECLHTGVDFGRNDPADPPFIGKTVFSATAGVVIADPFGADNKPLDNKWGRVSVFNPITKITVHYTHLQTDFVQRGQHVSKGIPIGETGDTAASRKKPAPNLHFSANSGRGIPRKSKEDEITVDETVNPYEAVFPAFYVSAFLSGDVWKIDSGMVEFPFVIDSGLIFPEDITTDRHGRVYVVENDFSLVESRITRINPVDSTSVVINEGNATINICSPEGLSFDHDGNLIVNTRRDPCPHSGVWKVRDGLPGVRATQIVPAFSDFGEGTAITTSGDLLAAGTIIAGSSSVDALVIKAQAPKFGEFTQFIDLGAVPGIGLVIPIGIAVDTQDNIYIADGFLGRIEEFDISGNFVQTFASGLQELAFIEIDSGNHLIVVENDTGRVLRLDELFRVLDEELAIIPSAVGLGRGITSAKLYRDQIKK